MLKWVSSLKLNNKQLLEVEETPTSVGSNISHCPLNEGIGDCTQSITISDSRANIPVLPAQYDDAKLFADNDKSAIKRPVSGKGDCIIIQGLSESSAYILKDRPAADLELFQELLNELL
ncbi:unnamed protein product [Dibothriocephalus latus]|uniref:Uncharacterized protein n=1 Tax=Dibothriocephalus latus TaxID=60516 RepID=A0A3P7LGM8_DIBLA|nr:unnamed protein product [Dibothriocephalus latus]